MIALASVLALAAMLPLNAATAGSAGRARGAPASSSVKGSGGGSVKRTGPANGSVPVNETGSAKRTRRRHAADTPRTTSAHSGALGLPDAWTAIPSPDRARRPLSEPLS